jgi:hypothetical protein
VLLPGARDALYAREVEAFGLHPGQDEVQCLDPHGDGGVDLVLVIVCVHAFGDVVVCEVGIKGDDFLVLGF